MKTNLEVARESGATDQIDAETGRESVAFTRIQLRVFAERIQYLERERCALIVDKNTAAKRQTAALVSKTPIKPSALAEKIRRAAP